jgi:hypothetical protein
MMYRANCASSLTVSMMFLLSDWSKSNTMGVRSCLRSSSRRASRTALRSGVKRPRIRTALVVIVSMMSRILNSLVVQVGI